MLRFKWQICCLKPKNQKYRPPKTGTSPGKHNIQRDRDKGLKAGQSESAARLQSGKKMPR